MKYLFYLLLLIPINNDNKYGNVSLVKEDNIYDAVNQIIISLEGEDWVAEGKPSCIFLLDKPMYDNFHLNDIDKLFEYESIQKYFSLKDKESFKKQALNYKNFAYTQNKIIGKTILPVEDLDKLTPGYNSFWTEYEQKYGQNGFYEISFPLFSADGTKMLVGVGKTLYGLDGHGNLSIYEKDSDKWVHWKTLYMYL